MTPTVSALLRKVATNRLAELRIEQAELVQALAELDNPSARTGPAQSSAPTNAVSPSSERLEELREQLGPVFRVVPKVPVEKGQRIKNADGAEVEMIEEDTLGNERGEVTAGAWFAVKVTE